MLLPRAPSDTKFLRHSISVGELYSCIDEQVYGLELLPEHKLLSKSFDLATIPAVKKYIPPMGHPWKQASFESTLSIIINYTPLKFILIFLRNSSSLFGQKPVLLKIITSELLPVLATL